jgi:hypothetical protein
MVAGDVRVLWAGAHCGGGRAPRALLWDSMGRSFRTRGWGCWGTQSVALGWYTVSRWDTGWGEGRRGSGWGRREVVELGWLWVC